MSKKMAVFLGTLAILFVFPFVWTTFTSFKPSDEVLQYPPSFIPENITFSQFQRLFTVGDGVFSQYIRNSLIISGSTIILILIISLLAAYALSKLPFKGSNLIFLLILSILMVPYQSLIIPLYRLLADIHLLDTKVGIILIYSTFFMPFCIFMAKSYFSSIPPSLRESALMDGATEFKILTKIYLPLSLPAIATIIVYTFLETWNDFFLSFIFTSSNSVKNIQVGIVNFGMQRFSNDWGILTSGSTVSSVFPIIVFLLLQKYYVHGITGAVKD